MKIANKIKDSFYPDEYATSLNVSNELELCLIKKKALARYCIALVAFDDDVDVKKQVLNARRLIRKCTSALWLVREVGVYIIFHTKNKIPNISSSDLPVDQTGFHAVIIQGVHVIGNNYKEHLFNHAKWFEHCFGGSEKITSKIKELTRQKN